MTGTMPLDRDDRQSAGTGGRSDDGGPSGPLVLAAAAAGGLAAWALLLPFGVVSPLISSFAGSVLGGLVLTGTARWRASLREEPEPYIAPPPPRIAAAESRPAEPAADRGRETPAPVDPAAALSASPMVESREENRTEERRAARIAQMDALGRLAGGFAHDFNNLMGAIAGYSDFLTSDLPPESPQAEYAGRILQGTQRGKDMLRRLTAFARSGAPELRPTGVARLLAEAQSQIEAGLPSTVTITVQVERDLPDLLANGPLLMQALVSLAFNACEALAAPDGREDGRPDGRADGRLSLRVVFWPGHEGATLCSADCPKGWLTDEVLPPRPRPHVLFEVRDNGPGLPDGLLPHLFEPFRPRSAGRHGDGLDLAVVLGIVRGHDGGLTVCTREGEGTVFRLFIPVAAQPARVPADAAPVPPVYRCRILVVDDEPVMADLMSAGLERLGHETAVCESADEALEVFHEEPGAFDVVIADQSMPGMSGLALIAQLKARRPDLVCVLYTGNSRVATDARAWAAGADAFFTKPVDIAEVGRRVAALAAARHGCPPAGDA